MACHPEIVFTQFVTWNVEVSGAYELAWDECQADAELTRDKRYMENTQQHSVFEVPINS
jgi:hypothetical protein